jgi:hypothetical protein
MISNSSSDIFGATSLSIGARIHRRIAYKRAALIPD